MVHVVKTGFTELYFCPSCSVQLKRPDWTCGCGWKPKKKNPMSVWWRRMMQKIKPSGKVYSKASRRANKVKGTP
jgi:hypothetical protein